MLIIGYFIPGVRHLTAYLAGISRIDFQKFMIFAYSGALLWSITFISLGYELGEDAGFWSKSMFTGTDFIDLLL